MSTINHTCKHCNINTIKSKAIINLHNIQTSDKTKEFETKLIDCQKCPRCGHSFIPNISNEKTEEASRITRKLITFNQKHNVIPNIEEAFKDIEETFKEMYNNLTLNKMKNQVIKNLNPEMGKEIIKYFQSLGVDTKTYTGEISKQDDLLCIYYGVIDGYFGNYSYNTVQVKNAEIIELPSLPKRGDKVLVWDANEKQTTEVIFITNIEGAFCPIVVLDLNDIDLYLQGKPFETTNWQNWKPLPKEEIVELTLEDVSNGKGVGVKPHLIRIKQ